MRIIAGRFKKRRILSIKARWLRPTSDRVREILFSLIHERVKDAVFLDLFAGTGALGIEAFSRGAKSGTFVDCSARAIALIKNNLQQLDIEAECIKAFATVFLKKAANEHKQFDIIFCDPPYQLQQLENILSLIANSNVLKQGGILVLETSAKRAIPEMDHLKIFKQRVAGDTCITIYEQRHET